MFESYKNKIVIATAYLPVFWHFQIGQAHATLYLALLKGNFGGFCVGGVCGGGFSRKTATATDSLCHT